MNQLLSTACETSAELGEVENDFREHVASLPILATEYVCPGESHPISHSIHLARLSSYYLKCRSCVHRSETGRHDQRGLTTVNPPVGRQTDDEPRAARTSLLVTDGVRGIYLNELDRSRASAWGAALASLVWDEEPRIGAAVSREAAHETRTGRDTADADVAEIEQTPARYTSSAAQTYEPSQVPLTPGPTPHIAGRGGSSRRSCLPGDAVRWS